MPGLRPRASIAPYFARPRRAIYVLGFFTTALFAVAGVLWRQLRNIDRVATAQFFSLPTDKPGTQRLRALSTPGLRGVSAHLVPNGNREYSLGHIHLPFPWSRIRQCNWGIHLDGTELFRATDARPERFSCGPGRPFLNEPGAWIDDGCLLWDVAVSERGEDVIFEYDVNERTRPVLESLELTMGPTFSFGNDIAMGGALFAAGLLGLSVLVLMSAGGLIVALVRTRRRADATSTSGEAARP